MSLDDKTNGAQRLNSAGPGPGREGRHASLRWSLLAATVVAGGAGLAVAMGLHDGSAVQPSPPVQNLSTAARRKKIRLSQYSTCEKKSRWGEALG